MSTASRARPLPAAPRNTPAHPPRVPRPAPVGTALPPEAVTALRGAPPASVEAFWERVRNEGTPLVRPLARGGGNGSGDGSAGSSGGAGGDGDEYAVTFLWRGTPDTRAVLVVPNKVLDPRDPARNLMERVPGTDVWHLTLRMRGDWSATYSLCVDEGDGPPGPTSPGPTSPGPAHWQWLRGRGRPDPMNRLPRMPPRWGGGELSVVRLPHAPAQEEWEPRPGAPAGTVTEHLVRSEHLGNERRVWLYTPPGLSRREAQDTAPLPLLVLLDGEMWEPALRVSALLDNLVADGRIPPVAAVLPESVDNGLRWRELACDERFAAFLTDELLPWAGESVPITDDPARTVVAGQSLGGLTAAFAALRAPHRFGNVLSQSGSFWWPTGTPDDTDGTGAEWLTARVREGEAGDLPVRFDLSAGLQEWVLLPAHRRLRAALEARGCEVSYEEFNGGHDYLCWRARLTEGLVRLLGRPQP
ncbi:enterochelin esterase [Streptomyces sp. SCUT-3]|uniref:enterochelin esterase n=1 Tax=Streptomyces sp. SCUT-3 TaxID=2684469 RepID=UPI0015FAE659|nr:enterochelin esterase [Streptomyces sp. SCUT-3]QMV21210.1 enterochelin esterase [Streptomyces sp. SCUT-3]